MKAWRRQSPSFVLVAALAFAGCGSAAPPAKEAAPCDVQHVAISVVTSPRLNPSREGEPRPVQLRIYQLKSDLRLANAEFDAVWNDDKATLGADLLKVSEVSVYPDERVEVQVERDNGAESLAGVALFRTPKGKSWQTTFALPPAPGKEACGAPCAGDDCKARGQNPRFAFWLDETHIDDGADHLGDHPPGRAVKPAPPPPEEKKP